MVLIQNTFSIRLRIIYIEDIIVFSQRRLFADKSSVISLVEYLILRCNVKKEREKERNTCYDVYIYRVRDNARVWHYNYSIISSERRFRTSGTEMLDPPRCIITVIFVSTETTAAVKNDSRLFGTEEDAYVNSRNSRARNHVLIRITPSTCLPIANIKAATATIVYSCGANRSYIEKFIYMPINLRLLSDLLS